MSIPTKQGTTFLFLATLGVDPRTWSAAVGDAERGTLHVILSRGDDGAFRVCDDALKHLETAGKVAHHLASSAAWGHNNSVGHVDSRIASTAVVAQVHSLTPALDRAGKRLVKLAWMCDDCGGDSRLCGGR